MARKRRSRRPPVPVSESPHRLRPRGIPPSLAASWLALGLLEVALHLLAATGDAGGGPSSAGARLSFAGAALLALFGGLFLGGLVLRGAGLASGGGTSSLRRANAIVASLAVWVAILLYGASWAAFWNTGLFLDGAAMTFWLSQPVQVLHWVYPPLALAVIVVTVVVAGAVAWVRRRAPFWPAHVQCRLSQTAAGALALCGGLTVVAGVVYGWDGTGRTPSPYSRSSTAPAGPLVHLALQLRTPPTAAPTPAAGSNGEFHVLRKPISTMEQYLAGVSRADVRPLNVVMIQVESLRCDQLRAYGGQRDVMPVLDALARESRVFTNAYVQSSHSNYADPVALSSHYPLRAATMVNTYPENPTYPRVLIYDVLKGLGYATAVFSSQNERWGGMINYHRVSSLDRFFHAGTFAGPTYTPWEDSGFAEWVKQTEGAGSVDDRYTVDEAIKWVDGVAQRPFFLHMNLQSSHLPYVVPEGFPRRFGPPTLDFAILWGRFPVDRVETVKDRYADSLFYVDTQIGRLFAHFRQRGLWDRTIVVIGGDNGEAFYEHGFSAHASWLFNEVVKVPMIVRAPGLEPRHDDRPAMFLDAPPSISALLGLPSHPSFQGISLFEPAPRGDRSLYMILQSPAGYETAIVQGRFKLHFVEQEQIYVLNDLLTDPGETIDAARSRPDVVERLSRRLHRWRDEQLRYYADVARQQREYPPVLED